jgi:tetratricopeptide (TPR) repeat protein
MPKRLFFSFLLLLLYFCSPSAFAQEKTPSFALITQEVKEAKILMKAGSFEKSLVKSRLALRHAIAIKDDNLIASSYHTIAANFDELSEYEKAFYYYNKGLIYANKTNNDVLKNWIYNNLGNIYCFDKKQYEREFYIIKSPWLTAKK